MCLVRDVSVVHGKGWNHSGKEKREDLPAASCVISCLGGLSSSLFVSTTRRGIAFGCAYLHHKGVGRHQGRTHPVCECVSICRSDVSVYRFLHQPASLLSS